MSKKIIVFSVFIIVLVMSASFATDAQEQEYQEQKRQEELDEAYNLGAEWGDDSGRVYGYKDYINDNEEDWYAAYLAVYPSRDYVLDFFNLPEDEDEDGDVDDDQRELNNEFIDGLRDSFYHAYLSGYNNEVESAVDAETETETAAQEHGEFFGEMDGQIKGKEAFRTGQNNDFTKHYPAESYIRSRYRLGKESDSFNGYNDIFLENYKLYFQIGFENAYREANVNTINSEKGTAYENGYDLGYAAGEAAASRDFSMEINSDWSDAYNKFNNEMNVFTRYNLFRVNSEYSEGFIAAFKEGYEIGYNDNYIALNTEIESRNTNFKKLSSTETEITYSNYNVEFIDGNMSSYTTNPISILVPDGAVYAPNAYIGISESPVYHLNTEDRYLGSDVYEVSVMNKSNQLILEKPIELKFDFYGDTRAAIYKYVNRQWLYLPTRFGENELITDISSGSFQGGLYSVIVDNAYVPNKNISLHWANEDLRTFVKRGYIQSNYNPDLTLTRKEFALMIYRNTYGNRDQYYPEKVVFEDKEDFGAFANAINFMVEKNYMQGVGNNIFDANGLITFKEVEIVMNRILEQPFTWDNLSEDMLTERFHQSKANSLLSNPINRGELIYMLNKVLGDQILFEQ
ncbi:MAG TPA: hypothetical protein VJ962_12580 [Clostridia bacterium]|nr:hypothetical protein [Clostridia bacterium]